MNRRRLHRWWLLNAVWGCILIAWELVLLALGLHVAWLLLPTVPLAVVQFVGWRKTRPVRPRPDYGRIAALEHELLGVEPRVRWLSPLDLAEQFTPRTIRRDRSPMRFNGGYVSGGRTGEELPPMPDSWTRRRTACRHEHPHTLTLVNGHADTICLDCGIGLPPQP